MRWEQELRSLLIEQTGRVEIRLRAALVDCLGTGRGDGYLDWANYDVSRLKNEKALKQYRRQEFEVSEWAR